MEDIDAVNYKDSTQDSASMLRWHRRIGYALFALQVVMTITGAYLFITLDLEALSAVAVRNVTASSVGLIVMFGFSVSIVRSRLTERVNFLFLLFALGSSVYLYADEIYFTLSFMSSDDPLAYAVATLVYLDSIFLDFVCCKFCYAWYGEQLEAYPFARRALYLLTSLACLLIIGNLWGGYYFTLMPDGVPVFQHATWLSCLVPGLILCLGLQCIFRQRISLLEKAVAFLAITIPYISAVLWEDWDSLAFVLYFCSLALLYTHIYVRHESMLARTDAALARSRLDALRMQMNPHFIYNAFGSVASLCLSDPAAARKIIYRLTHFLRDNFTDLTQEPVRSLEEEIRHVRQYLDIELIHYPDIEVCYDLMATQFSLPCLSVQPLVENAIQHGILKRREAKGTITIRSRETDSSYIVCVEDDGVGFEGEPPAGKKHIGIKNVALRLGMISHGTLTVTSVPGQGTVCELLIPKEPVA